ncbi:hypothetical protein AVEN_32438-1 [Araneus ventricosus]|uniref:C2H2-type domain-containing protein n=1 Tax=Araneus ventricosus TaxID=182803 RepID=A0A4Y2NSA8_ARAVE|nr:hypothetical protein AVEN_32438-1 [Araneus ventricosus]
MQSTDATLQNCTLPSQVLTIPSWGYITVDQLDSPSQDDDNQLYSSTLCDETFTLPSSLKKHGRLRHGNNHHSCFKCKRTFKNIDGLNRHIVMHNDDNDGNSRNKRRRRSSSPQADPSNLQSGGGARKRKRHDLSPLYLYRYIYVTLFYRARLYNDLCENDINQPIVAFPSVSL